MVCLRSVHTLRILPDKVTQEAHNGEADRLEPEHRAFVDPWYGTEVLHGHACHRRYDTIDGSKHVPNGHASRNGEDMVLSPVVGD
jgi:hypothetical protein